MIGPFGKGGFQDQFEVDGILGERFQEEWVTANQARFGRVSLSSSRCWYHRMIRGFGLLGEEEEKFCNTGGGGGGGLREECRPSRPIHRPMNGSDPVEEESLELRSVEKTSRTRSTAFKMHDHFRSSLMDPCVTSLGLKDIRRDCALPTPD